MALSLLREKMREIMPFKKITLLSCTLMALTTMALEPFRGERLWGFKDDKDKVVVEEQFLEVRSFVRKLAAVRNENGWGFINDKGKIGRAHV